MLNSLYGKTGQRFFELIKYLNKGDYELLGLHEWEDLLNTADNKEAEDALK